MKLTMLFYFIIQFFKTLADFWSWFQKRGIPSLFRRERKRKNAPNNMIKLSSKLISLIFFSLKGIKDSVYSRKCTKLLILINNFIKIVFILKNNFKFTCHTKNLWKRIVKVINLVKFPRLPDRIEPNKFIVKIRTKFICCCIKFLVAQNYFCGQNRSCACNQSTRNRTPKSHRSISHESSLVFNLLYRIRSLHLWKQTINTQFIVTVPKSA